MLLAVSPQSVQKNNADFENGAAAEAEPTVRLLLDRAAHGDTAAMCALGKLYLDNSTALYAPQTGVRWLQAAAAQDSFEAYYRLALYYRGFDAYQSYTYYQKAIGSKTMGDPQLFDEAERALLEDFCIELKNGAVEIKFKKAD